MKNKKPTAKPQKRTKGTITRAFSLSPAASKKLNKLCKAANRLPSNYIDTLILAQDTDGQI